MNNSPISTKEQRIKHTPRTNSRRGYWSGERGNSTFIPAQSQTDIVSILRNFGLKGISYLNGIIDLSPCSIASVSLAAMSTYRQTNFSACDRLCAVLWNETEFFNSHSWTSQKVKHFRKSQHFSWHERNDCITCDLVPTKINAFFLHFGGIAECKLLKK